MVKGHLRRPLRSLLVLSPDGAPGLGAEPDAIIANAAVWGRSLARFVSGPVSGRGGGAPVLIRIPPLRGDLDAALDAAMAAHPDGIVLPATVGGEDLQQLSVKLSVREALRAIDDGTTSIVAIAGGTPGGVLNAASLVGATRRLAALAWDGADLPGSPADTAVAGVARSLVVCAAYAAGVPAIDARGYGSLDLDRFAVACKISRRSGFNGMMTQDPSRVAIINRSFAS
jgi:citrate lyase subunit beta/citryl-CoA lyase